MVGCHRWDALVFFRSPNLRDWVNSELGAIVALARALRPPVAIVPPTRSVTLCRRLQWLYLGHPRRCLALVTCIHDNSSRAARVACSLAVILPETEVVIAEVYLGAHVLDWLLNLDPVLLTANAEDFHVWVQVSMIEALSRVSALRRVGCFGVRLCLGLESAYNYPPEGSVPRVAANCSLVCVSSVELTDGDTSWVVGLDLAPFVVPLRAPVLLVTLDTANWYCSCQLDCHSVMILGLRFGFTVSVTDAGEHLGGYGFILHYQVLDAWMLWVDGWAVFESCRLSILLVKLLLSLSEGRANSIEFQVQ